MGETSLPSWLEQLAAKTATPGGGAAAGLGAAIGAALLSMVANYTTGERYAEREPEMRAILGELAAIRATALQAMDDDEEAFGAVAAAYAMARADADERAARAAAIQLALSGAAEPPQAVGRACARLVEIATALVEEGNPNVISDVGVAAAFARAAVDSALLNVAINASQINDDIRREELGVAMDELRALSLALGDAFEIVRSKLES